MTSELYQVSSITSEQLFSKIQRTSEEKHYHSKGGIEMCACKGTGVIRNDQGSGCYQFVPCICEAANQTPEDVDRRRHAVMAELREIHQLQLEGKWDVKTWNGFGKGELHNRSTVKAVHEELAS